MARKTIDVTITAPGRDLQKVFKITEMGAIPAEKWAQRAFLAIARSGIDVPAEAFTSGVAGIVGIGMAYGIRAIAGLTFADAEPLLDEMMTCVQIIRDPRHPEMAFKLLPDDIEEVATILLLRDEVIKLHTGFSVGAVLSRIGAAIANPDQTSSDTPTSETL